MLRALAALLIVCGVCFADESPPKQQPISLMGMLSEWQYPNAEFQGAQSSDGGVSGISSVKSKALLTTSDSVENVMEYYCKKLHVDAEGKPLGEKPGERITTDRSVLIQDASGDRPSTLFVIAVNRKESSTTLVVSRATGDKVTRIAWSNYHQLRP